MVYLTWIVGANSCYRCSDTPKYVVDAKKSPNLFLLIQAVREDDNEGCMHNNGSEVDECDGDRACTLTISTFRITLKNESR